MRTAACAIVLFFVATLQADANTNPEYHCGTTWNNTCAEAAIASQVAYEQAVDYGRNASVGVICHDGGLNKYPEGSRWSCNVYSRWPGGCAARVMQLDMAGYTTNPVKQHLGTNWSGMLTYNLGTRTMRMTYPSPYPCTP